MQYKLVLYSCLALIFDFGRGSKIYQAEGEDVVFSWTLNPTPGRTTIVNIKNGAGFNLFSARGTLAAYSDVSADRTNFTGNTTAGQMSFSLRNISVSDAGQYKAEYPFGTDYLGPILIVLAKPDRPTIMHETAPVVKSDLVLKCSARSNSVPNTESFTMNYIWNVPHNINNYTRSGPRLTINAVSLLYTGLVITCASQDVAREPAINGTLSENSLPYVIDPLYGPTSTPALSHTSPQTAVLGTSFPEITCVGGQCNPDCNYTWSKQGQETIISLSRSLVIGTVEMGDKGTYFCTVGNVYGKKVAALVINVLYPAHITNLTISGSSKIYEGGEVTIICSIDSNPSATVTWAYKNNDTVTLPTSTSTTNMIKLQNVSCNRTGTYICNAGNRIGLVDEKEILLEVFCSPRIDTATSQQQHITRIALDTNENLVISSVFNAYPVPSIKWHFRSKSDQSNLTLENGMFNVTLSSVFYQYRVKSNLVRTGISEADLGNYTAVAENELGRSLVMFEVTLKRKPDYPTKLSAKCKSQHEAEISWSPGFDGGDTQNFTILYRTKEERSVAFISDRNDQKKNITDAIAGLKENTFYYFQVLAENEYGTTISFEIVNCTTLNRPDVEPSTALIAGSVIGSSVGVLIITAIVVVLVRRYTVHRSNEKGLDEAQKRNNTEHAEYEDLKERREINIYDIRISEEMKEDGGNITQHYEGILGEYEDIQNKEPPHEYLELDIVATQTNRNEAATYVNTDLSGEKR